MNTGSPAAVLKDCHTLVLTRLYGGVRRLLVVNRQLASASAKKNTLLDRDRAPLIASTLKSDFDDIYGVTMPI